MWSHSLKFHGQKLSSVKCCLLSKSLSNHMAFCWFVWLTCIANSARQNHLPLCKIPDHMDSCWNYTCKKMLNNGKCDLTLTLLQFKHIWNIAYSHAQDKADLQVLRMVMMSETSAQNGAWYFPLMARPTKALVEYLGWKSTKRMLAECNSFYCFSYQNNVAFLVLHLLEMKNTKDEIWWFCLFACSLTLVWVKWSSGMNLKQLSERYNSLG